jgi:hypothetical protein
MRLAIACIISCAVAAAGCQDSCVDTLGPGAIVSHAVRYQIDLYSGGVACANAHAAKGAPAPQMVRTFAAGQRLTFNAPSGDHTIVLTAFSTSNDVIGSACYRGRFGLAAHVCLTLELVAPADLGVCTAGPCPCVSDGDCASDRYCAPDHTCQPGCRDNAGCMSSGDGGQTVPLPQCDVTRHECVGCRSATDCVRAPGCQGNVVVAYPPGGSPCVNGACVYSTPSAQACQLGCYQGACSGELATLNDVAAWHAGTQTPVDIAVVLGTANGGGLAPATRDVTVVADTGPPGAAKSVSLVYMLNGNFGNQTRVPMSKSSMLDGANEQWSGAIPRQPAGTRVYFFVTAVGWDGTTIFAPGAQRNYAYASN